MLFFNSTNIKLFQNYNLKDLFKFVKLKTYKLNQHKLTTPALTKKKNNRFKEI